MPPEGLTVGRGRHKHEAGIAGGVRADEQAILGEVPGLERGQVRGGVADAAIGTVGGQH